MTHPLDKSAEKKARLAERKKARKVDKQATKQLINDIDQIIEEEIYLDIWGDVPEDDHKDMTAIYGDWGTGKSAMALSFPSPIWYIDTEDGLKKTVTPIHRKRGLKHLNLKTETKDMVARTGRIHKRNRKKEMVVDVEVLFHRLQLAGSGLLHQVQKDPDSIGTVVIDDVGHLKKYAWEWRVDAFGEYEDKVNQRKLDLGATGKKGQSVGEGWDNARSWASATQKATSVIDLLKGQDFHLVVISKVKQVEDQVTKNVTEVANWHNSIPGLADNVVHVRRTNEHGFSATVRKARKQGEFNSFNKTYPNKNFSFNYEKLVKVIAEDGKLK